MEEHKIVLPAKLPSLGKFIQFVLDYSITIGFSEKRGKELFLALEEAIVNIISYAYPEGEEGDLTINCRKIGDRKLLIEIADSGKPFDMLAKPDPDITLKLGERKLGGLGIFFIKKIVDDVSYRYENKKNILTMHVTDDIFLFVENSSPFHGLAEGELNEVITYFHNVNFKKGDAVITMGETSDTMFIHRKGECKVSIPQKNGTGETVLGYVQEGALVGEIGAITNEKRRATITCMTDVKLLTITTDDFWKISEKYPAILRNIMKTSLGKYLDDLAETTAARERIESELNIASEIQMGILPRKFPAFPERKEFDVFAFIEPAKEVGGDFYDFFMIDEDNICFVIGDVSGKGVPAALFMAITKTLIRIVSETGSSPGEVLERVNKNLWRDNPSKMFVTIFLGIMNLKTGEVRYTNGGHNPPLIIPRMGEAAFIKLPRGLLVGARVSSEYKTIKLVMNKGDSLFMYTDGVTEAMNEKEELFSEERLNVQLSSLNGETTTKVVNAVYENIKNFTGGAPQSDDITIMALKYEGR